MSDPFEVLDEWTKTKIRELQKENWNHMMGQHVGMGAAEPQILILFELRRELLGEEYSHLLGDQIAYGRYYSNGKGRDPWE